MRNGPVEEPLKRVTLKFRIPRGISLSRTPLPTAAAESAARMAQNQGIQYDDGMEVVPPSDPEVIRHPAPTSDLEAVPPSDLELAKPIEQPEKEAISGPQILPAEESSPAKKKRWTTRRVIVLVVITFLVLVVVALGAGLGISAKNKEQSQSMSSYDKNSVHLCSTAPNTRPQVPPRLKPRPS